MNTHEQITPITIEELKEHYLFLYARSGYLGSSSRSLTTEQKELAKQEAQQLVEEAKQTFIAIVELAADQFLQTPIDQRLSYLENLRGSLKQGQGFSASATEDVSDQLTLTLVQRLTNRPQS